jgi:hypothetical protein
MRNLKFTPKFIDRSGASPQVGAIGVSKLR